MALIKCGDVGAKKKSNENNLKRLKIRNNICNANN